MNISPTHISSSFPPLDWWWIFLFILCNWLSCVALFLSFVYSSFVHKLLLLSGCSQLAECVVSCFLKPTMFGTQGCDQYHANCLHFPRTWFFLVPNLGQVDLRAQIILIFLNSTLMRNWTHDLAIVTWMAFEANSFTVY